MVQVHVGHMPIPLIKGKYDGKSDKSFVKMKFCRYPTSSVSDLCEFKMPFFDNGEPEEVLLFVRNFNITLAGAGTLETGAKVQYRHILVHGDALYQFDSFSSDLEITEPLTV